MKLSTRTRYGMRFMLDLAFHDGEGAVLLGDIAKREEISDKYLSQIVIPLKSAGLITATRGAKGGYTLAKPSHTITAREIFEALEGGLSLVDCAHDMTACGRSSACVTRILWSRLEGRIVQFLETYTLSDMAEMYRTRGDAIMYSI